MLLESVCIPTFNPAAWIFATAAFNPFGLGYNSRQCVVRIAVHASIGTPLLLRAGRIFKVGMVRVLGILATAPFNQVRPTNHLRDDGVLTCGHPLKPQQYVRAPP
jgi:hypothetical protein